MRIATLLTTAVLAQTAATSHLRYQRTVKLPALADDGTHTVCTVLDAEAFAHTASRSADDLRLYRQPATGAGGAAVETPFNLFESEAAPEAAAEAAVEGLSAKDGAISFDLAMPHQDYTTVELHLAATDFVAEAVVSGGAKPLGTFTLFDLTQRHLARSTELALQEAKLPRLHVELRLWHLDGSPVDHPSPAIVQGAEVPPSRQAQTLYTTVAATSDLRREGELAVAELSLPAHVPVERIRFVLAPGEAMNLFRPVMIEAVPVGSRSVRPKIVEAVQGTIARIDWRAPSGSAPPVHYESLTVDATLGANLRQPATVRVTLPEDGKASPVRAVELQMRQRSLCFQAVAGERYTLRYGDAGLPAPVYDDMAGDPGRAVPQAGIAQQPYVALLGPEELNPEFQARPQQSGFTEARPVMFWVGLLSMVTLSGALAAHRAGHDPRRS